MAAHGKGCVLLLRSALLCTPAPFVLMCIWAEVMKTSGVSKFAVVGLAQISALLQGDCQWFRITDARFAYTFIWSPLC